MGVNFKLIFILTGLIFILSSCRTSAPRLDYQALARASILLGVDINMEDNHKLYLESAEWIGVPYRGGGDSNRLFGTHLPDIPESIPYSGSAKYRRPEKRKYQSRQTEFARRRSGILQQ